MTRVENQDNQCLVNGAELYRLAALIYLKRMAKGCPRQDANIILLLDQAFGLLERMGVCERPWPLFVIALEARDDGERRVVVDVLEASVTRKPGGNLERVRSMIMKAWVQLDLSGGDGSDLMRVYDVVVSGHRVPPSFT